MAAQAACRVRDTSRALGVGMTMLLATLFCADAASAHDERSISFFNIHTKETLTVVYKRNGAYVPEAMKKLNWILRDWRQNKATTMDPETIDIIWEMHRELGSQKPVHIISGYRSPATNSMLRKTRGGQAKKSQHMTGRAIDITFPDVPLKRMRYSAMIRERGGVGYYPTSGIPFVHVDTARVRHWPRMVHDELALLFPSGRTKHVPSDGKPIKRGDATIARQKRKDLARDVAQYFAIRDGTMKPEAVQVAEAWQAEVAAAPVPVPAKRPASPVTVASLPNDDAPQSGLQQVALAPPPKLVSKPRLVDRPSEFVNRLPDSERSRLDMLIKLASLEAPAQTTHETEASSSIRTASLTPSWSAIKDALRRESVTAPDLAGNPLGEGSSDWRSGWNVAPAYDEDHPDELAYRPFALGPLLTETPSFDDPALVTLVHPDAEAALQLLDDEDVTLPMRFGSGQRGGEMVSSQAFIGDAVNFEALAGTPEPAGRSGSQLVARSVKTEAR